MAYQVLTGIKVKPRGLYNIARFGKDYLNGAWPNSFAFGGWIYTASVDIGFSNAPTEIKLNIVLETVDRAQQAAFFNIKSEDLRCDAGSGGKENLYDFEFNGVNYTDFILFSYEINIEGGTKTLSVVFKDYSIILDKIYVGLFKRQGNKASNVADVEAGFPVRCIDCQLTGGSVTSTPSVTKQLAFGSYVGINGLIYDNFADSDFTDIYEAWDSLFDAPVSNTQFDLNGGYLIIGTENISEEECGELPEVTYNFNELLASLRFRGLRFSGAFPTLRKDGQFIYKQNYNGTLREVLQNWASDLGFDFFCQGKEFVGIDVTTPIDISAINQISDPASELGSNFSLDKPCVIKSYKEGSSLNNTFKQAVITENTKGKEVKVHSKTLKRFVGFAPLHPLDINSPKTLPTIRHDVFDNEFVDNIPINNSFSLTSNDLLQVISSKFPWEYRPFVDVDACMALGHYNEQLRDLYCQDIAIHGDAQRSKAALMALGFIPLQEITDGEEKQIVINHVYSQEANAEISSFCLDNQYFKVYVGYYYPAHKEETERWEQTCAESMYKFGALKKGLTQTAPYVPYDLFENASATQGLYSSGGLSLSRITHQFEPSAEVYLDLRKAPYKDLLLYSGVFNSKDYIPSELYIASLDNEWGTEREQFTRSLNLQLDNPCVANYNSVFSVQEVRDFEDHTHQNWRLELFTAKVNADLKELYDEFGPQIKNIVDSSLDKVVEDSYGLNFTEMKDCAKIHLFVIPNTRTHPNIDLRFSPRGRDFVNPVVLQKYIDKQLEEDKRRARTKRKNVCDKSLLEKLCDALVAEPSGNSPLFGCTIDDSEEPMREGFPYSVLTAPNSRGLDIRIEKNPNRHPSGTAIQQLVSKSDFNGEFYYNDILDGYNQMENAVLSSTIIYPISMADPTGPLTPTYDGDIYYNGILSSSIEIENRAPEMGEILGEPVNTKFNNAATVKVINNKVDADLLPQLDPHSNKFMSYITVRNSGQALTTVQSYHDAIASINSYETQGPSQTVELVIAGTPEYFGSFKNLLTPTSGLTRLSISVNDNGVETSLSFADKPPQLPKQESILNKIGPRLI